MRRLFYAIFYQPQLNFLFRNITKAINRITGSNFRHSVSGTIRMSLTKGRSFKLELNESSAAHVYFWLDAMNYEFTPIFIHLAEKARVFMDIGTNIGFYTGVANAVNPEMQVWSFEPANGPHHYLCRNKERNNWKNTSIHKIALSDKNGSTVFFEGVRKKFSYLKYHLSGIGAIENTYERSDMMQYTVPVQTLDSFVSEHNIKGVDIIKMDTEATEHYILSQATETLRRDQPIVICEVLFGKVEKQIEPLVRAAGLRMFEHTSKGRLIETDSLSKFRSDEERTLFFVPPSKISWIEPFIDKAQ